MRQRVFFVFCLTSAAGQQGRAQQDVSPAGWKRHRGRGSVCVRVWRRPPICAAAVRRVRRFFSALCLATVLTLSFLFFIFFLLSTKKASPTMGDRKNLQQYYPPDFDPSKLPRVRRAEGNMLKVS